MMPPNNTNKTSKLSKLFGQRSEKSSTTPASGARKKLPLLSRFGSRSSWKHPNSNPPPLGKLGSQHIDSANPTITVATTSNDAPSTSASATTKDSSMTKLQLPTSDSARQARQRRTVGYLETGLEEARKRLDPKEKVYLQQDTGDIASLIQTANQKQEEAQALRMCYMHGGKKVFVSDKIASVAKTFQKYAVIGDVAIGHSPEVTALIWGAFRALLQFTTDIVTAREELFSKMNEISLHVAECELYASIFEAYVEEGSEEHNPAVEQAAEAMTSFYAAVFVFIAKAIYFFTSLTEQRSTSAITIMSYTTHFKDISDEISLTQNEVKNAAYMASLLRQQDTSGHVKEIRLMVEDLTKVTETINLIYLKVEVIEENQRQAELRKVRKWLNWRDPKNDLKLYLAKRMGGTCMWIFEDEKFKSWLRSQGNSTLWIRAKAGTGKSVVAASILQHLLAVNNAFGEATDPNTASNPVVLYYFFRDQKERANDAAVMLTTLIGQLLNSKIKSEVLFGLLRPHYKDNIDSANIALDEPELWSLLQQLLEVFPTRVLIVLDALDECEPIGRKKILDELSKGDEFPARFLITGRPEMDINQHLQKASSSKDVTFLEMNTQEDIDKFIEAEVESDPLLQPHRDEIVGRIKATTDGMFIYAATMFEMLHGPSGDKTIKELLDTMPTDLNDLYQIVKTTHYRY
ncbi:hypothetical protein BJ508DRAFT_74637 [Ascobolus immersus RN42]|uniref:Uncharacterized protein n=1 Tax=Ascobolus immersus RN42 TaxID=1160509 RepID=A0A3N4IAT6_ASCIM|nr:hypothetical protein BJ508DRAFT_74637 [Ascobolus immersus RN42]